MLMLGEKPRLLILDPSDAAGGRVARKSLERLDYPVARVGEFGAAHGAIGSQQAAVVMVIADASARDPASLCSGLLHGFPAPSPALVLLCAKPLERPQSDLAAVFVAPFDWDAIVDRLTELLSLSAMRRERAALASLLQLSRVEMVSIETESQSCSVGETLGALLGLPEPDGAAARRERTRPMHWQRLFEHCDEPDRQRVLDTISGCLESGIGFEAEYDLRLDRNHKRRLRLTGHPSGAGTGAPPRRVDLVVQDVTPVVARSSSDAGGRLLETTLGLRRGDRVLQSLIRIVQEYKQGTILLIRLQGLADFYRQYGYESGGASLRAFAEAIESGLREVPGVIRISASKQQVLARLAGGEFLVLIPDMTDDRSMVGPLSRLLQAMRAAIAADERLTLINARIGMATWPRDGSSPDVLLRAANLACDYFALDESDGLDTVTAAVVRAREQARLEFDLHYAIERAQLQLHYQPKLSMEAGRLVGFEALLRWQHRPNLLVPPAIFIPIAERTGLIARLGAWVIEQAAEQIAIWRSQGVGPVPLAVNVSSQQFRTGDLVSVLNGACARHRVEPASLQTEITESCLIDDTETAMRLLGEIRRLGCEIALDDFGTGYSSLSYLQRLPLDILKIDRSFTISIGPEQGDRSLAFNIIGIGRSLGLRVIAEGVASAAQWQALRGWGCAQAQGYLISQPVPAAAVPLMWHHGAWDAATYRFQVPATAAATAAAAGPGAAAAPLGDVA